MTDETNELPGVNRVRVNKKKLDRTKAKKLRIQWSAVQDIPEMFVQSHSRSSMLLPTESSHTIPDSDLEYL